ncbi:hypothetical protein GXW82_22195 [Streptacidiphilus sp. 4-A2]|nr:hypothetical protein [Streptacidiphilus sp. 4-A2]
MSEPVTAGEDEAEAAATVPLPHVGERPPTYDPSRPRCPPPIPTCSARWSRTPCWTGRATAP